LANVLREQWDALAQLAIIQRLKHLSINEVAGIELGRRFYEPTEVSSIRGIAPANNTFAGNAKQGSPIAK
jgi:hypothetical protein